MASTTIKRSSYSLGPQSKYSVVSKENVWEHFPGDGVKLEFETLQDSVTRKKRILMRVVTSSDAPNEEIDLTSFICYTLPYSSSDSESSARPSPQGYKIKSLKTLYSSTALGFRYDQIRLVDTPTWSISDPNRFDDPAPGPIEINRRFQLRFSSQSEEECKRALEEIKEIAIRTVNLGENGNTWDVRRSDPDRNKRNKVKVQQEKQVREQESSTQEEHSDSDWRRKEKRPLLHANAARGEERLTSCAQNDSVASTSDSQSDIQIQHQTQSQSQSQGQTQKRHKKSSQNNEPQTYEELSAAIKNRYKKPKVGQSPQTPAQARDVDADIDSHTDRTRTETFVAPRPPPAPGRDIHTLAMLTESSSPATSSPLPLLPSDPNRSSPNRTNSVAHARAAPAHAPRPSYVSGFSKTGLKQQLARKHAQIHPQSEAYQSQMIDRITASASLDHASASQPIPHNTNRLPANQALNSQHLLPSPTNILCPERAGALQRNQPINSSPLRQASRLSSNRGITTVNVQGPNLSMQSMYCDNLGGRREGEKDADVDTETYRPLPIRKASSALLSSSQLMPEYDRPFDDDEQEVDEEESMRESLRTLGLLPSPPPQPEPESAPEPARHAPAGTITPAGNGMEIEQTHTNERLARAVEEEDANRELTEAEELALMKEILLDREGFKKVVERVATLVGLRAIV